MKARQDLPRVTVVTVVFNIVRAGRVEHFRECMDSVRKQTHPDIEHLIIDGASTDGTLELLKEYDGKNGVRVLSEPDTGIYDAMNKGIAAATGKYIAFLNSDDYWHDPRGIEYTTECMERSRADFSYAPCHFIEDDGRDAGNFLPEMGSVCSTMPFCHQTMFTRVDSIRQAGGFADKELRITADYDLILNLLVHGAKPVFVPMIFTTFRLGGANTLDPKYTDAEFRKSRERWLQPLVPFPVLDYLETGFMPDVLYRTLFSCFHPSAMLSVMDAHGQAGEQGLLKLEKKVRRVEELNGIIRPTGHRYSWLLGLPLLYTRYTRKGMHLFLLFGFLPILGNVKKDGSLRSCWKLFGLIPALVTEHRLSGTVKCRLFGIPIWNARADKGS